MPGLVLGRVPGLVPVPVLVPVAMRERYDVRRSKSVVEGRATYGTFRLLDP
ncbi:MAG: hypothetical protein HC857_11885 [Synechococcales cyanobacterium RU_4_20]|nr:hypothetical protein [Synechococcales cyanobacterium RU_4_20]